MDRIAEYLENESGALRMPFDQLMLAALAVRKYPQQFRRVMPDQKQ